MSESATTRKREEIENLFQLFKKKQKEGSLKTILAPCESFNSFSQIPEDSLYADLTREEMIQLTSFMRTITTTRLRKTYIPSVIYVTNDFSLNSSLTQPSWAETSSKALQVNTEMMAGLSESLSTASPVHLADNQLNDLGSQRLPVINLYEHLQADNQLNELGSEHLSIASPVLNLQEHILADNQVILE